MDNHYNKLTHKQIALENQKSINDLTNEVELLKKNVSETSTDVKRILFYFNSDKNTNTEGFIEKSNRHDKEIKEMQSEIKDSKTTIKSSIRTAGFIFGGITSLVGVLIWIVSNWEKIFH